MRRLLLLCLTILAALSVAASAQAADRYPLHVGSSGHRVKDLQWLLGGHKPNVFTQIKGTYQRTPSGYFGSYTGKAVKAYKYRMGYPTQYVRPIAGKYFFALLRGRKTRPSSWVVNAASRVAAIVPGATPRALAIRHVEQGQLGVSEYPYGSNCGLVVHLYQRVTGAICAAWCVSFQQWSFVVGGYGTFADRTAGVFYAVGWAGHRNYLHAKPKVGAIVAFMDGQGHMGYVVKVLASGFVSIEGNASNRVLERFHSFGDRRPVYIYLPGVA